MLQHIQIVTTLNVVTIIVVTISIISIVTTFRPFLFNVALGIVCMTILVSDVAVDVVNEIIFNAEFDVD